MFTETFSARSRPFSGRWATGLSALLGLALTTSLYSNSFVEFAAVWNVDSAYLFGYLIVPLALLAGASTWLRRPVLAGDEFSPLDVRRGLQTLLFGVAAHFAALFFHNLAVDVFGLILIVRGVIAICAGHETLRSYNFATLFLALLIPITVPVDFFPSLTAGLQRFVAFSSTAVIDLAGVPVFRDGLDLRFGALTLTVDAARSGLSAWQGVLACCLFAGFVSGHGLAYRATLAFLSLPIAAAAQSCGLIVAGILLHWRSLSVAEDFVHSYYGWRPLLVAVGLTLAVALALHTLVVGLGNAAGGMRSVAARIPRKSKGSAA